MAYKFDEQKSKATFDKMFGKGFFDSSMQQARDIGRTKVQADMAKTDYMTRLKASQAAAKKAATKKTYNDATAHWNDPTNKAALQNDGAYRAVEKIKNDPNQQAQIKAQGYNLSDYYDAMYNAASGGQYKSEREYNQFAKQLNKDNAPNRKANQDSIQMVIDTNKAKADQAKQAKNNLANEKNSLLGKLHLTSHTIQTNPILKGLSNANEWLNTESQRLGDQVWRSTFGNDFVNSNDQWQRDLSKEELKKNPNDTNAKKALSRLNNSTSAPKNAFEKGLNYLGGGVGNVAPYLVGDGLLGIAEKGAAGLTKGAAQKAITSAINPSKLVNNPVAKKAIQGAMSGQVGGALGLGAKMTMSNEHYTPKQIAENIALNGAMGAIANPLLYGAGKGLSKLFKKPTVPTAPTQELLGLPAPQLRLNSPQLQLPGPKPIAPSLEALSKVGIKPNGLQSPIPGMPKPMSEVLTKQRLVDNGINFGQGSKYAPKARPDLTPIDSTVDPLKRGQAYWQKRYEDFVKTVSKSYDTNRMTQEGLDQAWSQFAKYDEPISLNQVVDLAYPKGFQASPTPKVEVPKQDHPLITALKNDPKINEKIKGFYPPVRPEPNISRPATLDEMVQRFQALAPPKQTPVEPSPLNFRVSKGFNPNLKPNILNRGDAQPSVLDGLKNIKPGKAKAGKGFEAITSGGGNVQNPLGRLQAVRDLGTQGGAIPKGLEAISAERLNTGKGFEAISPGIDTTGLHDIYGGVNFGKLKDINGLQGYTSDIYRNTRDVFGKHFPTVKQNLLDPFDNAKKDYVTMQENWLNSLDKEVVKGLGIKKGSKLSKLVQDYGEKNLSLDELKQQAPNDWKKVVKADQWFRQAYNQIIDHVNATRSAIYPNNPEKIVPKMDNYYRHFKELNGLEGLKNLFDTPAGINPQLVGTSDFTTPNSKFAGFMQKRGLGAYKSDAVGGFLNYLPSASYATKIDPHIENFKGFANTLKDATEGTKNLNHYIEFLTDFSRDLAGKTNFLDRPVQKIFGRRAFNGLNWLNNRVKKNAVLGNLGSALAQVANVPNGIAFAKQYAVPGAAKTIKSLVVGNEEAAKSGFLKERFSHEMYQKFNSRLIDQPEKFAGWMMSTADKIGTQFIWNSAYEKGLAKKIPNPIKYADDQTRNLVAGRGIGEVPLLQKSKVFQFLAPFQLEVANMWKVQKDFVKEKDFGALVTLYVGSWLLNRGTEQVRGSKVTFDPIQAIHDAVTEKDISPLQRAGRVAGEVLGNVPLGQTLANFYPEFGTKSLPTRADLFGSNDPNRFGTGLLVQKGLQDPLYKLALPFGGGQVEKTVKGLDAIKKKGVYNQNGTQLKYPVSPDPLNSLKGLGFGVGGLRETKDFYDNKRKPLGTKQTEQYNNNKQMGTEKAFYDLVMQLRAMKQTKKK